MRVQDGDYLLHNFPIHPGQMSQEAQPPVVCNLVKTHTHTRTHPFAIDHSLENSVIAEFEFVPFCVRHLEKVYWEYTVHLMISLAHHIQVSESTRPSVWVCLCVCVNQSLPFA